MEPDLPGLLVGRGRRARRSAHGSPAATRLRSGRGRREARWWPPTPVRKFAWQVNNGWVHWEYTFEPEGDGTRLTEPWEFLPAGIAGFHERYGADAEAQIEQRRGAARSGIPATLAAIKKAAEVSIVTPSRLGAGGRGHPEDLDLLGDSLELLRSQAVELQARSG